MSFYRNVDLASIVDQYHQHSHLSRSELTQRICDEAATLAQASPYDRDLYFAVSDAIAEDKFFSFHTPAALYDGADTIRSDFLTLSAPEDHEFPVWKEKMKHQFAAVENSRDAQALAQLYYDEGNYPLARTYFEKAALFDNNLIAYLELGYMSSPGGFLYSLGNTQANLEYAFRCFRYAADNGLVEAYFPLAMAYWEGQGVEKDEQKAFEWLNKAHVAGNLYAKVFLAECLINGKLNVTKNPELAYQLIFNQALPMLQQPGNPFLPYALYVAGYVYQFGYGDLAQAINYYEQAAALGFSRPYFMLFAMYMDGRGCVKNTQRALHYLYLAAEQNHPDALYNLAKFHLDGTIESGNEQVARELLIRHCLVQYASDCRKQPGVERVLAAYLLVQLKNG